MQDGCPTLTPAAAAAPAGPGLPAPCGAAPAERGVQNDVDDEYGAAKRIGTGGRGASCAPPGPSRLRANPRSRSWARSCAPGAQGCCRAPNCCPERAALRPAVECLTNGRGGV